MPRPSFAWAGIFCGRPTSARTIPTKPHSAGCPTHRAVCDVWVLRRYGDMNRHN